MLKNVDHFLATNVVLPASAFLIQNDSGEKYLKDPFFIHLKKLFNIFLLKYTSICKGDIYNIEKSWNIKSTGKKLELGKTRSNQNVVTCKSMDKLKLRSSIFFNLFER